MYRLYRDYLDDWFDNGGGLFVHYGFVQTADRYGSWGLLEHLNQPPEDAPKYRAIREFVSIPVE
jgi:hypothetical protein